MGTTADTAPRWVNAFGRYSRAVEQGLLVLSLALFVFCLADWRGWLSFEREWQPLRMVYLSGALVLQPVASLVQRRSMPAYVALLAASIVLLVMSAAARS